MRKRYKGVDMPALAKQIKEQFEMDLEPVAGAMAEILAEINTLSKRIKAIENRRPSETGKVKFRFDLVRGDSHVATKEGGDPNVTHELMTAFFNTPSPEMLARREAAEQALTKQYRADQAKENRRQESATAFYSQFDTPRATQGVKNFDYSDIEARRKAHSRMVAQNIKDRVFRRL